MTLELYHKRVNHHTSRDTYVIPSNNKYSPTVNSTLLVLVSCKMHWLIGGSSSDRLYNAPFAERAWLASISKTVSNLENVTALCRDQVSHSLTIMISRNTRIVPQPVVSNHHLFFLESDIEMS